MKRWLLIIPCFAFGMIEQEIDEKEPVEVAFSTSSHNRIAVKDGAVEKVFGDPALFAIAIDPSTGSAFVNVLRDIEKPVTLSIVTSYGLVQDLLVTSQEGQSETVFLMEKEEEVPVAVSIGSAAEMLNTILEGGVPFGYGQMDWDETLALPEPLEAKPLKAFQGPFETIAVYSIKNTGSKALVLSSDALKKENAWVFLKTHELQPGQETICVQGRSYEE